MILPSHAAAAAAAATQPLGSWYRGRYAWNANNDTIEWCALLRGSGSASADASSAAAIDQRRSRLITCNRELVPGRLFPRLRRVCHCCLS